MSDLPESLKELQAAIGKVLEAVNKDSAASEYKPGIVLWSLREELYKLELGKTYKTLVSGSNVVITFDKISPKQCFSLEINSKHMGNYDIDEVCQAADFYCNPSDWNAPRLMIENKSSLEMCEARVEVDGTSLIIDGFEIENLTDFEMFAVLRIKFLDYKDPPKMVLHFNGNNKTFIGPEGIRTIHVAKVSCGHTIQLEYRDNVGLAERDSIMCDIMDKIHPGWREQR